MGNYKLMQIIPSLSSGGVEQGTLDLANYIADKKYKNIIVSNGGRMLSYLNKKYVSHYKLPVHSKNFFKMPIIAKNINTIIKENNINILHIRSRAPAWLLPYIQKKKLTTVSTFHNIYGYENFIKRFYNKGLSKTDYIVAISEYVGQEISKQYDIDQNRIKIINRGIDTNFYNPSIKNDDSFIKFIGKYDIPSDKKIIIYPGRLTSWKGQFEFLNIVKKLKDNNYFFYFVGDDKNSNYRNKLINKIKKNNLYNCKLLGHLDSEDLKNLYYCADLVISMPLKPEGFGRIISESLAMKKIILAKNFGGAENQLRNLDNVYKINSSDDNELIEKIKKVLNILPEDLVKIKTKGREHVIRNFSKIQMLENYTNFYNKIIQ